MIRARKQIQTTAPKCGTPVRANALLISEKEAKKGWKYINYFFPQALNLQRWKKGGRGVELFLAHNIHLVIFFKLLLLLLIGQSLCLYAKVDATAGSLC